MGYSSDIYWHQTTKDGFKKIMDSAMFKSAYSIETICWRTSNKVSMAIPMISFCNLSLSDISEYLGKYGSYVIGMRKSWKYTPTLSPVWYRTPNSISLQPLMDLYIDNSTFFCNQEINSLAQELIWTQISCTKNFEGSLKRRNIKLYRFFDEHEFRYVPKLDLLIKEHVTPILNEIEYQQYKKNNKNSSVINNQYIALPFNLEDIEFILVKGKGQIAYVNKLLDKVPRRNNGTKRNPFIFTFDEVKRNIIGIDHHKLQDIND